MSANLERKLFWERVGRIGWSIVRGVIILGICYVIFYPLIVKISSSLMREVDMFDNMVQFVPRMLYLENYRIVWEYMDYPVTFRNSLVLTLMVSLMQLASCTLIGYGFARFKWKGQSLLFACVVFTLVVPPQMIMIPLYLNFRYFTFFGLLPEPGINLLGSIWPFVFTSLTGTGLKNGLFIYIMRQFFRNMPKDLEEAAAIDGAGAVRTFLRVMLPNAVPAMLTIFLFAFVWQWNDYFFTSIYLSNAKVLPVVLESVSMNIMNDINYIADHYRSILDNTGMILFIAPLLILYAILQRYFIEGVERTGIVG
ncbi:MAG: carbohydrate ABC transporter permease [Firmicutes bacterium]|nr:carbohydrate ABC transporter permease [Bacillota bacterium]